MFLKHAVCLLVVAVFGIMPTACWGAEVPPVSVEEIDVDSFVLPDGTSLAANVTPGMKLGIENDSSFDSEGNGRFLLTSGLTGDEELGSEVTAVATKTPNIRRHLAVDYAALVTVIVENLPKVVKGFIKEFGKPRKRHDLVCVSHREDDLTVLVKDATYCHGGSTIRKIPSCVAAGSCTSLKDGGLAHISVGYHYQDNLKRSSADKSIRKLWAEWTVIRNVADRIQRVYGVDTVKVQLWDTFNAKKNTVTQYTLQYNGYGGVAYVYFYCGVNHYMKDNYKVGWFRKRARDCATLAQPFAYSVYGSAVKKGNNGGPNPDAINDF